MSRLIELWNETLDFTFWQTVGIGLLFCLLGAIIYMAGWLMAKAEIEEYAYPKWSSKRKRRQFSKYSFADKVLLLSLHKNAVHRGAFLQLCWGLHLFRLLCSLGSLIGFVCILILPTKGWQIILILFLPLGSMLLSVVLEFVPSIICLPSVRQRYHLR